MKAERDRGTRKWGSLMASSSSSSRFSTQSFILSLLLIVVPSGAHHTPPTTTLRSQMKMLMTSDTLSMTHFKPGVAADALPESFHYNKYIPLLFKLLVPELSPESLKLNTSFHCASDPQRSGGGVNQQVNSPLCPVTYHLDRILAPIADSINFAKNIYAPTEGWSFFGKFSCNRIEPHFFHLSAHTDELHLYTDKLQKRCPLAAKSTPIVKNLTLGASEHVTLASDKFNSILSSAPQMKDKNLKKDGSGSGSGGDHTQALQLAGYVGFLATHLLTKYVDTIRWNNAFSTCQSSRLSIGLVNSFWLRTALIPLKGVAEREGYKLALMAHEVLPHYYKLPLTDCILGMENNRRTTLLVRLLVPIIKMGTKYTRFRLTKIPYLITEGGVKKICEIQGFDPKDDFLVEETVGVAGASPIISIAPTCFESELCHVAEQPRDIIIDLCVKGLLNGSVDHVRDFCSFDCFPLEENEELVLPIIIRVATNQYSITGSSPPYRPISVYCDDKLNHTLAPNATNGVMQVVLPCNCDIRFKSEIYRSSRPCDAPYEAHLLSTVPFNVYVPSGGHPGHSVDGESYQDGVLRMTSAVLAEKETSHLLDVQNGETGGRDPVMGNPNASEVQRGDEVIPRELIPASWIFPGLEDQRAQPMSPVGPGEGGSGPIRAPPSPPTSGGGHGGQLALIWILLILLCLSNGLLFYVVHQNRMIDLSGVRLALNRWGLTSSGGNVPRSRLREEGGGGQGTGAGQNQLNIIQGPGQNPYHREENANNGHNNGAYVQEEWPQHLNRL